MLLKHPGRACSSANHERRGAASFADVHHNIEGFVSASKPAERKALGATLLYRTIAQRKALMKAALLSVPENVDNSTPHGFIRPAELLQWVVQSKQGPKATRGQVIEKLARKPLGFGSRRGELGAVMLYELRRKKLLRWVPPGWPQSPRNWLTLERLMDALATNSDGKRIPAWLHPPVYESLDDYRDTAAALKILTTSD
jgi:hypothetical protein